MRQSRESQGRLMSTSRTEIKNPCWSLINKTARTIPGGAVGEGPNPVPSAQHRAPAGLGRRELGWACWFRRQPVRFAEKPAEPCHRALSQSPVLLFARSDHLSGTRVAMQPRHKCHCFKIFPGRRMRSCGTAILLYSQLSFLSSSSVDAWQSRPTVHHGAHYICPTPALGHEHACCLCIVRVPLSSIVYHNCPGNWASCLASVPDKLVGLSADGVGRDRGSRK